MVRRRAIALARLNTVYNVVRGEVESLARALRLLGELHVFYHELYSIEVGEKPEETLRLVYSMLGTMNRLYREYRAMIAGAGSIAEINYYLREASGRLLSLLRRKRRVIEKAAAAIKAISRTPDVSGDIHVIIAGMPQVGKSTLLSRLSKARPEIAPYPFTTKSIIVGHMVYWDKRIVLIDTPGILDRPLDEKNKIELRAAAALRSLADKTVFLIDVSKFSYYNLTEQVNVYRWVKSIVGENILLCINKIDATSPDMIKNAEQAFDQSIPCRISALQGKGIEYIKKWIVQE